VGYRRSAAPSNGLSRVLFQGADRPGRNAPGGAARYIVHGKMIGGFDWSGGRHITAIPWSRPSSPIIAASSIKRPRERRAPDQLRPRRLVARPPVLAWLDHIGGPHRAVDTATVVGRGGPLRNSNSIFLRVIRESR